MTTRTRDEFIVHDFKPAYLDKKVRKSMPKRVSRALEILESCNACPRSCKGNRAADKTKFCKIGRDAQVSSAFPHLGEEDCLRGWRGSGTIFFAGCNLKCVYCQNADISQQAAGEKLKAKEIAALMLELQAQGCHNINFVTPEHVVPQVIEALEVAIDSGLELPIVYNTSAYDSVDSLKLMDGLVDIYMPDFKFWENESSRKYVKAKDYPKRARDAIREMHRQVGDLKFTPEGIACRGVLVRHLVMPDLLDETAAIFKWLAKKVSPDTYINIMPQYHPANLVGDIADSKRRDAGSVRYAEINRRPTAEEIEAAYDAARAAGLWRFDKRRELVM